jgi:hypothetical protein
MGGIYKYAPVDQVYLEIFYDRVFEAIKKDELGDGLRSKDLGFQGSCRIFVTRKNKDNHLKPHKLTFEHIHNNKLITARVYDLTQTNGFAPLEIIGMNYTKRSTLPTVKRFEKITRLDLEEVMLRSVFVPIKKK